MVAAGLSLPWAEAALDAADGTPLTWSPPV